LQWNKKPILIFGEKYINLNHSPHLIGSYFWCTFYFKEGRKN